MGGFWLSSARLFIWAFSGFETTFCVQKKIVCSS